MGKWKSAYSSGRKYRKEWEKEFFWLRSKDEGDSAWCNLCKCKLPKKLDVIRKHKDTMRHQNMQEGGSMSITIDKPSLPTQNGLPKNQAFESAPSSGRKYRKEWEKEFPWLGSRDEGDSAWCNLCKCKLQKKLDIIRKHKDSLRHQALQEAHSMSIMIDTHDTPSLPTQGGKKVVLGDVVAKLEALYPPEDAASWDNVGLLVEARPRDAHVLSGILVTNDLTEPVLDEAVRRSANLIVAYHPPIFHPLKRLSLGTWKERLVVQCIQRGIAVYSPHTACDVVVDGANDFLNEMVTDEPKAVAPVQKIYGSGPRSARSDFNVTVKLASKEEAGRFRSALLERDVCNLDLADRLIGEEVLEQWTENGPGFVHGSCTEEEMLMINLTAPPSSRVMTSKPAEVPLVGKGHGRVTKLQRPILVRGIVHSLMENLRVDLIQVALPLGAESLDAAEVSSYAVCAGSGGSVLKDVKDVDLVVTGELSHHETLDFVARGVAVITCNHTNTERAYLRRRMVPEISELVQGEVPVFHSEVDKDPFRPVTKKIFKMKKLLFQNT